jgi:stage II sporulation protein D
MYMSTCGGRTEDFSEVFDTAPVPYLRSVFCTVDSSPASASETNLSGNHDLAQVLIADDGTPANRELELACVLGLTVFDRNSPDAISAAAGAEEIRQWVETSRLVGGKADQVASGQERMITSRAGFLSYAAERFFGSREIERTVSDSDAEYYSSNFSDGARIPASARRALAYLVQRKLWQPYPDNSVRPDQPIRRCDALTVLVRWIIAARPEVLNTGIAADPNAAASGDNAGITLAIKRGNRNERLRLSGEVRLFKVTGNRSVPVDRLHIIGGEKLFYHQQNGEIDFLEVELSATGAASDRLSPVASWQATITRAAAAEKLRSMAPGVGELRDLKPAKIGASGRVVRLEIIGSRGSVVVNGLQVRSKLGLKDTLYTLSRTRADDGTITSFVFDGKGWGHGVGLCQTGAVGMARAGRSAEQILKAYYQGVELRKAY